MSRIEIETINPDIFYHQSEKGQIHCSHCGEVCPDASITSGDKVFCCPGCRLVYEILAENDLCDYYNIDENAGVKQNNPIHSSKFDYLNDETIIQKLIDFSDGISTKATFHIPDMHCSSCVWLLESLYRLNGSITYSTVNFLKKELSVTYNVTEISLRGVVELLSSIGYEPQITLESIHKKVNSDSDRDLYIKIGVAGFCFANIMMLSFPEYLVQYDKVEPQIKMVFTYLALILSFPVFFYSSIDYFKSALKGWQQKMVNMDVPISLGILTLFIRSTYDIVSGSGTGFMDSFSGLVFLLLLGKLFQKKTYDTLSFDRDYKSYFPISVTKKSAGKETTIPLENLKQGDRIVIRNQEIIPADSILINGAAFIDYSFVTGESNPVTLISGDVIHAGGRQIGGVLEVDIIKYISNSYLTRLWNDDTFKKSYVSKITTLSNSISKYFTIIVLLLAGGSALYWLRTDFTMAINAFTAVLIVACPCALALSTPFTLGNVLRIFGKNKFYLKNISVIEALARINSVVFDKTGTITRSQKAKINFTASPGTFSELSKDEKLEIYSMVRESGHPLSRYIYKFFPSQKPLEVKEYHEVAGQGIKGRVNDNEIIIGSNSFLRIDNKKTRKTSATVVYIKINGKFRGYFQISNSYRLGLKEVVSGMVNRYKIYLLTGDNDSEKLKLSKIFLNKAKLFFNQSPYAKLNFIKKLQKSGEKVLMIGDGLNDAGALKQSDVGISISEDVNTFSPACDAILESDKFNLLYDFIKLSKASMKIIIVSFSISFFYNLVGLYFAMQGTLSPLIAAILMPISSISVVLFTTGSTALMAKRIKLL